MLDMVNPFPSRGSPLMSKIVWHKITKGTVFASLGEKGLMCKAVRCSFVLYMYVGVRGMLKCGTVWSIGWFDVVWYIL